MCITRLGRWSAGAVAAAMLVGGGLPCDRGSGADLHPSRAGSDAGGGTAAELGRTGAGYSQAHHTALLRARLRDAAARAAAGPDLPSGRHPGPDAPARDSLEPERAGGQLSGRRWHPDGGQRVLPVAGHQRPRLRHLPPAAQRHGPQPAQHPLAMVGDRWNRSPVRAGGRRRLPERRACGPDLRCPGRRADRHRSRADSRRRTRFWSAAARSAFRCLGRRGPRPARSSRSSSPWRSARATTGPAAIRTRLRAERRLRLGLPPAAERGADELQDPARHRHRPGARRQPDVGRARADRSSSRRSTPPAATRRPTTTRRRPRSPRSSPSRPACTRRNSPTARSGGSTARAAAVAR